MLINSTKIKNKVNINSNSNSSEISDFVNSLSNNIENNDNEENYNINKEDDNINNKIKKNIDDIISENSYKPVYHNEKQSEESNIDKSDVNRFKNATKSKLNIDEYADSTDDYKKILKLDLIRKLADLWKSGIVITSDYNLDSDYYTMKAEYDYHIGVRSKKQMVKTLYGGLTGGIKFLEFLNKKYNPFGVELDGWSTNIETSKEELIDAIGEIYEKYKQPGEEMSPELKIVFIIATSAVTTIFANSGAKILSSMFGNKPIIDKLEKEAIAKSLNNDSTQFINQNEINHQQIINEITKEQSKTLDQQKYVQELRNRNYTMPEPRLPNSLSNSEVKKKNNNEEIKEMTVTFNENKKNNNDILDDLIIKDIKSTNSSRKNAKKSIY
jgi:hypothetical protein